MSKEVATEVKIVGTVRHSDYDYIEYMSCPACGYDEIGNYYDGEGELTCNYCPDCGQKLKYTQDNVDLEKCVNNVDRCKECKHHYVATDNCKDYILCALGSKCAEK